MPGLIFRQALGAGGADVVLVELFEHGGADHAGEDGGKREAQGDRRKDKVQEEAGETAGARSGDGKPAELDGEEQDENGAQGEVRKRKPYEGDDAKSAVLPAATVERGGDAGGDR